MDDHELFEQGPMSDYLVSQGWVAASDVVVVALLGGGVSNHTAIVTVGGKGSMVVKKARARLDVEDDWRSDPRRALVEARALHWLLEFLPPGTSCPLYWVDEQRLMFAGAAVPDPHTTWKDELLAGRVEPRRFEQFAALLAQLHARSSNSPAALEAFSELEYFETLRVDPFYRSSALAVPELASFFTDLVDRTLASRRCLVHGDASPKNVLLYADTMVLIDHEVIHTGDPCFDVGFALSHFLSKAHHVRSHRAELVRAIDAYLATYAVVVGSHAEFEWTRDDAERAGEHAIACLLARVVGKSPMQYLSRVERDHQLFAARAVLDGGDLDVAVVAQQFMVGIERLEQAA